MSHSSPLVSPITGGVTEAVAKPLLGGVPGGPSDAILTEGGNFIITESGDFLILEEE